MAFSVLVRAVLFCATVLLLSPPSIGKELARLQYDPWDEWIIVPVKVFGETCWFVIDTGSTGSSIDESFRDKLGPILDTQVVNENYKVDLFAPPLIEIGDGLLRSDQMVGCHTFGNLQNPEGKRILGLIGMDLLGRFVLQLDPDQKTISLMEAGTTPAADWGSELSIAFNEFQTPIITGRVNTSNPIALMLDLGDPDTFDLSFADARMLPTQDGLKVVSPRARSGLFGATKQSYAVRADSFGLGPYVHSNLVFILSDRSRLGLHYFRRYKTTFDFPRSRLYLKPSKHFDEYDYSHEGLIVFPELVEGKGYKLAAYEGSPAGAAGIQNLDLLLELDGCAASAMGVTKITRYLQLTTSRDIAIVVQRGEQLLRFTLPRNGKPIGSIVTDSPAETKKDATGTQ